MFPARPNMFASHQVSTCLLYPICVVDKSVNDFYDETGWNLVGGTTTDALINENLTEVARMYVHNIRAKIGIELGAGGNLLDVGCGPIQYPEYLEYSKNFDKRICVDLSSKALEIAKSKIGDHGAFFLGDYLDIRTGYEPYSGATLINVLYHVDIDLQEKLVRKVISELKEGAALVVVYSNPKSFSSRLTSILVYVKRIFKLVFLRSSLKSQTNPIYFKRHDLNFWHLFEDDCDVKVMAWRTFSPAIEKVIFRRFFMGKKLLDLLFRIEKQKFWAKIAEYQIITLKKIS
jgi:SAM-dependent methyltransferase